MINLLYIVGPLMMVAGCLIYAYAAYLEHKAGR